VLASVALGLLTYPLVEGRDQGWPAWSFVMLAASLPTLALFVAYERAKTRRDGSPLVELAMFRDRAFSTGTALSALFFSAIPAFFLIFSLTLQIGLGYTPLRAGLTTLPWSIATAFASAMSVRLAPRLGKRILSAGCILLTCGMVGIILTMRARGTALDGPELIPTLLVAGLGMGCIIAPLTNIILAGIHQGDAGSASGVLTTMQQVGGAIGVAVVGVIFFGLIGGRADTASASVVGDLRAALASAHVPATAIDRAVQGFQVCFHDRANENDPSQVPPSCARVQQQGASANPVVQAAFAHASATALGRDFEDSVQLSLAYQIVVFLGSFAMVFALPSPARRTGMAGAGAAAH
jgi:hypothetical protein